LVGVIVGDLDRVTFSIKIDDKVYRVCGYPYVRNKLKFSTIKYSPESSAKIHPEEKKGGLVFSFAELMRAKNTPEKNNYRETAAFIASILLLIKDVQLKDKLYNNLSIINRVQPYIGLIDYASLKKNKSEFKDKTSHKVACSYITKDQSLFSQINLTTAKNNLTTPV